MNDTIVDILAAHRLTRLVTTDTFPPMKAVRDRVLARFPIEGMFVAEDDPGWSIIRCEPDTGELKAGDRVMICTPNRKERVRGIAANGGAKQGMGAYVTHGHSFGELATCPWCAGFHVCWLVLLARRLFPRQWNALARPLAASSIVGWLSVHLG